MKMILKSALATAAIVGVTTMFPVAASAAALGVSVGIAVPAPVVVVASPYGPGYAAFDEQYYYDPIFISGSWYHGPYRWRMHHGERQFMVNGRWHRNEWRDNSFPETIVFHNGGRYGAGRYDGFDGAERINVRFHRDNGRDGDDHRGAQHDGNDHHDGDHDNNHHDKNDGPHN